MSLLGRGGMGEVFRADDLALHGPAGGPQVPARVDDRCVDAGALPQRGPHRTPHLASERVAACMTSARPTTTCSCRWSTWTAKTSRHCCGGWNRLPHDKAHRDRAQDLRRAGGGARQGRVAPGSEALEHHARCARRSAHHGFQPVGLAHEIRACGAERRPTWPRSSSRARRSRLAAIFMRSDCCYHEPFTGKPAFDGKTHDEIVRVRRENTPHRLSTLVRDLDPAVALVIRRCLEEEPEHRPLSALILSAALPGGEYLIALYRPDYDPSVETDAMERESRRAQRRHGGCRCQDVRGRSFLGQ